MNIDALLDSTAAVADPSDSALEHGLKQLAGAVESQRRATRGRRVRHYGLLAGVGAILAAAAVLVPSLTGSRGSSAEAATVLRQAAQSAGQQPGGWPDAAYWHSVSTYVRDGQTFTREIWISHYGTTVLKDPGVDTGIMANWQPTVFPAGGSDFTWDQLYALPTDPTKLAALLRSGIHGAGPDDDSEMFTIVGDLLRESPASPALRRALYEVAATIPGVTSEGTVTDRDGRTGTAVKRGDHEYIIDPATGRLLQEQDGDYLSTYESQGPATSAPSATPIPGYVVVQQGQGPAVTARAAPSAAAPASVLPTG